MTILNMLFIRAGHAHTDLVPEMAQSGICLGLTERGIKECAHAANALRANGVTVSKIMHSPETRAHQSALVIIKELELPTATLVAVDDLRNVETSLQGQKQTLARINHFLDQLAQNHSEPAIVVSHASVWQALHDIHGQDKHGRVTAPTIDTGEIYAARINRETHYISSRCLFGPHAEET